MTVYYFARPQDGAIKIGFTDRPVLQRLREVANSTGTRLTLVAAEEGSRETEQARHRRYAKYRISGEWFRHEGELRAFTTGYQIGALDAQRPPCEYLTASSYWAVRGAVVDTLLELVGEDLSRFGGDLPAFGEDLGHRVAMALGAQVGVEVGGDE